MGYNTRGHPQGEYTAGQYVVSAVPCGLVAITLDNGAKTLCTATIHDIAAAPPGADIVVIQLATKSTVSYSPCKPDACSKGIVLTVAGAAAKCTLSIE
jgi:hypothetical protein